VRISRIVGTALAERNAAAGALLWKLVLLQLPGRGLDTAQEWLRSKLHAHRYSSQLLCRGGTCGPRRISSSWLISLWVSGMYDWRAAEAFDMMPC
jgi:hypothetical protein